MALPELICKNSHGLWILSFGRIAAKDRASMQHGNAKISESASREVDRRHVFRKIAAGHRKIPLVHSFGALDRPRMAKLLQLRSGDAHPIRIATVIPKHEMNPALDIRVRIRI